MNGSVVGSTPAWHAVVRGSIAGALHVTLGEEPGYQHYCGTW